ncbi:MAG: pyridoxamine 5'-phosphate oxidase family protein [Anaeromyxobacteraceae bacterium]
MTDDLFHAGERAAQARAGVRVPGSGGIRGEVIEQHRRFLEALPFVVVGVDAGRGPAATVVAGPPGFLGVPDPRRLRVGAPPDRDDPAQAELGPGAGVALLGIDLATRRRNRVNGAVTAVDPAGFDVAVAQAFGNCPKYIHPREVEPAPRTAGPARALDRLGVEERARISSSDTFFVATSAGDAAVDVSHRAGPAGFVRIEGDVLTVPDYPGNRYFNTLGNLLVRPRAALLFLDFDGGGLLEVSGRAEVVWSGREVEAHAGAERVWRVHVDGGWRRDAAVPLRFR